VIPKNFKVKKWPLDEVLSLLKVFPCWQRLNAQSTFTETIFKLLKIKQNEKE
jgi:hypothetical protein